jgi:uncharacterized protein (DUF1800 family)
MGQLRSRLALLAAFALLCLSSADARKHPGSPADDRARAIQALSRLTFGPRPGDVDRVLAIGVDQWIDQQLHPDSIKDDALQARLSSFRTLRMQPRELAENFPPQAMIRQAADGKEPLPRNPEERAIYEAQLVRYREQQEKKSADAGQVSERDPAMIRTSYSLTEEQKSHVLAQPADQRLSALLQLPPQAQLDFMESLKGPARNDFLDGMSPAQRETALALQNPQQVVTNELLQAKLLRATYSERQLQEVMTDFWMNHFNVFIGKGADRYELGSYERDVIRPRALGKFEDLLVATAQSPAMLFYLDNWLSVGPGSDFALGIRRVRGSGNRHRFPAPQSQDVKPNQRRSGLNENYGRELMELHTLGVNGGYTQKDVTEVAKIFTGWTLKQPREGGGFTFNERMHQPGTKTVLRHKIKESGEKEGYEVLRILARNPSTAKFICTKLAIRFVSDGPPPALVDRMAKTFLKKKGDIRAVLETMLQSPEFWAPETYRAKIKTPLEFVASALRVTGAEVNDATPLIGQLQAMGMPLYGSQPPTGYSMKADAWVSSSALLGRMNFALRLTSGKIREVRIAQPEQAAGDQASTDHASVIQTLDLNQELAVLEGHFLEGEVSKQTHETIAAQLRDPVITGRKLDDAAPPPNLGVIEGLLLGSPEFQRR